MSRDSDTIDLHSPDVVSVFDELPLWSARFGLPLLDLIPLREGSTMVDVGAGTGFLTTELAQRCGRSSRVIAVDPWAEAMQRLTARVHVLGLRNVELVTCGIADSSLPAEFADLIVSNLGVNNFENRPAALACCFQILKPGGLFAMSTNLQGHMQEFYEVFRSVLGECSLEHIVPHLEQHIAHRVTAEQMTLELEAVGFHSLQVHRFEFQERYASGTALLQHFFIRLGFLPAWKALLPESQQPEVFLKLEMALNRVAQQNGQLILTIPAACITAYRPQTQNS